jgi:hypothetical protein
VTVKDWVTLGALIVTLVGVVTQARVAMALRVRDRQDHEKLREDHDGLAEKVGEQGEKLAELKGKIG